jgi:hypothetical protein
MNIAPDAPPSKLSKKFIALVIPTIQREVSDMSSQELPKGLPRVFVITKKHDIPMPKNVCMRNLGQGKSFRISSTNPTIPIIVAGTRIVDARIMVSAV